MNTTNTLVSRLTADELRDATHATFSSSRYADADCLGIDLDALASCSPESECSRYTVYQPSGFVRGEIITADRVALPFEISLGSFNAMAEEYATNDDGEYVTEDGDVIAEDEDEYAQRLTDELWSCTDAIDCLSVHVDFGAAVELDAPDVDDATVIAARA